MCNYRTLAILGCGCICALAIADEQPEMQFKALTVRFQAEAEHALAALDNVTDADARMRIYGDQHPANTMAGEFLKFEEANRGTQLGLSALHHLVSAAGGNIGFRSGYPITDAGRKALNILAEHYADHPDLDAVFESIPGAGDDAKLLLRRAMTSPHRHVRGAALLTLANIFRAEAQYPPHFDGVIDLLAAATDRQADKRELYTSLRRQWTADPATSREEALRLLNQIDVEYSDVLEPPRTGYGPILLKIERSADDALTQRRRRTLAERAESMRFQLEHLSIGQPAPEIVGPDAFGNDLKLSDQRGKVTVLMFSFKGCGPCEEMYPSNRKLIEDYRGRPFAFLGVMGDDDRATVQESVTNGAITWPVWWDGGRPGPIANRWNVGGWPDIYVLDHQGTIRYIKLRGDLLDLAVAKLVKEAEENR